MSRLHSKRKGQASSKRPFRTGNPPWVTMPKEDVEALVIKLAREGNSTALIGMKLRDQHGVPSVQLATGKSIIQILGTAGIKFDIPEDLNNLLKRATALQSHLKKNPRDIANRRGLTLIESKIRRLGRYYQREGLLPPDWKYVGLAPLIQQKAAE